MHKSILLEDVAVRNISIQEEKKCLIGYNQGKSYFISKINICFPFFLDGIGKVDYSYSFLRSNG
ncbi:hypothetical protein E0W40_07115 [Neisseria meningitidis]|nr:hypothetical protein [Neisseria meningitidis]